MAKPLQPVKRVLLCRPTYFTVDYVINPHMKPYTVDINKAMQQWQSLVDKLTGLGIKIEIIEQRSDVPDMVFATDQGIVRDGAVLLANFRYHQRKPERIYYREWFRQHGFKLLSLSNIFPFEGGDTHFFRDMLFVGTGFRASVSSCEEIAKRLNIDVIPLRLVDPKFYHLDIAFLPVSDEAAFYYPAAFSESSQNLLKRLVPNLIELSDEAVEAYAANAFVSAENIIISAGTPVDFRNHLQKLGLKAQEVDIGEFKKAGGGIHCLINVLE